MFRLFRYKKNNVEDYGATVYKTEQEALNGRSSTNAINDMKDDVGKAVLPDYGYLKHDGEIFLYKEGDSVIGGCHLVSDTNNNMFRPINHRHKLKGFTAIMKNGGSVVYAGGEHKGAININGKHQWWNRTQIYGNEYDFDFISNYTATPIRLDFTKEVEGQWGFYSHAHMTKIRGLWKGVDTGLVIHKKENYQSMNTFDIDVKIIGYNKMADIRGINFSEINIMGQLLKDTGELFYIKGSELKGNIFTYVEGHKYEKGNYHVKNLDLSGYFDILPYPPTIQCNLNDSKLI